MKKVNYYISTYTNSLLEDNKSWVKPLDNLSSGFIMDNRSHFIIYHKFVLEGRVEFKERISEARLIIFISQDLVHWIEKFMEDCEGETNKLSSELHATIGYGDQTKEKYLTKTGRLVGLYMEAERFNKMISAIRPININKPDYKILDELEKLDQLIIDSDKIPGYYSIPKHDLQQKQTFQLRNLQKSWIQHLEWGKNNPKRIHQPEFGKIEYYFDWYHGEFKKELINTRPREKVKAFLDYHLSNFEFDHELFINHIKYRIKPELKSWTSSQHSIYEGLIEDWISEKRNLMTQSRKTNLIQIINNALEKFLDDIIENRKRNDENLYNIVVRNLINSTIESYGWKAYDQSQGGKTFSFDDKKVNLAFRDLIIDNEKGSRVTAIEAFRTKSIPKTSGNATDDISLHLNKIFSNEPLGISPLFIIVYMEQINFSQAVNKYFKYLKELNFKEFFESNVEYNDVQQREIINLKQIKSVHKRDGHSIELYHFLVNMNT